jgi:hypothetical protein
MDTRENNNNNEDQNQNLDQLQNSATNADDLSGNNTEEQQKEVYDNLETDKYLAMEQAGVTYTPDSNPTNYTDYAENGEETMDTFDPTGENSRNSDAFGQDDYILNDNLDLDEENHQSISSDD